MGAGKSSLAREIIEEAKRGDIAIKHIELDTIAHEIYSTLSDPYYSQIRSEIRRCFGDEISPGGNWIDR